MEMTLSQLYQYLEELKHVKLHKLDEGWHLILDREIKETQERINKIIIDSFY